MVSSWLHNNCAETTRTPNRSKKKTAVGKAVKQPTATIIKKSMLQKPPRGIKISKAGREFLKCAFAPPDFSEIAVTGVPDGTPMSSLLIKSRFQNSLTFSNGIDYYLLMLPIPGFAYFIGSTEAGKAPAAATTWYGVSYTDAGSLFGPLSTMATNVVTGFRTVSRHFELVSTMNEFHWSGSITTFRMKCSVSYRNDTTNSSFGLFIDGLESTTSTNSNMYIGKSKDGVYTYSFNRNPDFEYSKIYEDQIQMPPAGSKGGFFGIVEGDSARVPYITGYDNNFDAVCVKISGHIDPQTFVVRAWDCTQYQVNSNSSFYGLQVGPVDLDQQAMMLYRKIIMELPVAVPAYDNESFWRRVLGIIRRLSGAISVVPGPYGYISGGVNMIAGGIEELLD